MATDYLRSMGDVDAKAKKRTCKYRVDLVFLDDADEYDNFEVVTATDADDACGKVIGIFKGRGKKIKIFKISKISVDSGLVERV